MLKNLVKRFTICCALAIWGSISQANTDDFYPQFILKLDAKFSHHIILVEKSTHTLYVYENLDSIPKLVKSYPIATGKNRGNKYYQGDHRTPEGIYTTDSFISQNELIERYADQSKIYGAGAFTLNYPNYFDRMNGKTGGGIWIHSTDDETRIDKGLDSRGCVVVNDSNLKDLSQFIDLEHTPVIIVEQLTHLKNYRWQQARAEIENFLNKWETSWRNENLDEYIDNYHPQLFSHNGKNINQFKNYKRNVFIAKGSPQIRVENTSILTFNDYAIVNFEQHYQSSTLPYEIGKKTLYLKKDQNYQWKIVNESWNRLPDNLRNVAFKPSSERYFNNTSSI